MKLHQYYLGKSPEELSDADYEKLLNEWFRDMAAVGAVVLSEPYVATDFKFRIGYSPYPDHKRASVTFKSDVHHSREFDYVKYCVGKNKTMLDVSVYDNIHRFAASVGLVISSIEDHNQRQLRKNAAQLKPVA